MKRLYRSEHNKVWKGILGGLGEYFDIDPVIIRLIFIVLLVATGFLPMVIVYIIAIFVVPKSPVVEVVREEESETHE